MFLGNVHINSKTHTCYEFVQYFRSIVGYNSLLCMSNIKMSTAKLTYFRFEMAVTMGKVTLYQLKVDARKSASLFIRVSSISSFECPVVYWILRGNRLARVSIHQ